MIKEMCLISFLSASFFVCGQEIISTQGNSYSNSNGTIDYTIGEVVIQTGTNGTHDLTQGFHQTNWNFVGLEDLAPDYEASIFPNPTSDFLIIKTSSFENSSFSIYDAQGKLILHDELLGIQTSISVNQLAAGSYSLVIVYNELDGIKQPVKQKTFRLIKTQ